MKYCKHQWDAQIAKIQYKMDLAPGGINYIYPPILVEICVLCHKIRNKKEDKR